MKVEAISTENTIRRVEARGGAGASAACGEGRRSVKISSKKAIAIKTGSSGDTPHWICSSYCSAMAALLPRPIDRATATPSAAARLI